MEDAPQITIPRKRSLAWEATDHTEPPSARQRCWRDPNLPAVAVTIVPAAASSLKLIEVVLTATQKDAAPRRRVSFAAELVSMSREIQCAMPLQL